MGHWKRWGFGIALMLLILIGSGYVAAGRLYRGYSVREDQVKVTLGRSKGPGALEPLVERAYVSRRHRLLRQLSSAQPRQETRAVVVFGEYLAVAEAQQLVDQKNLSVAEIWLGRPGFLGVGTSTIQGNNLAEGYAGFTSSLISHAAGSGPNGRIQKNAKAAQTGEFAVFALVVGAPAHVLDSLTAVSGVRLVDPYHNPQAEALARARGLKVGYIVSPVRPDEDSVR